MDMGRTPMKNEIMGLRYVSSWRLRLYISGELKSRIACKPRTEGTNTRAEGGGGVGMHGTRMRGMHRLIACKAYGFEGGEHSDAARIGSGDAVVAQLHHQAELNKGRVDRDCMVRRPADVS